MGEKPYGELLDSIRSGIIVWRLTESDDAGALELAYANPAASRLTGVVLEGKRGETLSQLFPRANPERLRIYAECCRARERRDLGMVPNTNPASPHSALHIEIVPVGQREIAVVFEPAAPSRSAEADDDKLKTFLANVIEHLPTMVFMKEAKELRFEYFNRAGEELLGLERAMLLGKNDHDFFPTEQADFFVAKDREVLRRGTVEDIPEEPIETPRGRRWLHTRKIPILDAAGEPQHLLGVSVDITQQKLASDALEQDVKKKGTELEAQKDERRRAEQALRSTEEQLRQAQKMEAIGRLAGGVAHDFNNLLSVIMSYSMIALEGLRATDPLRGELGEVVRAAERAGDLTRQLLAFSRQQVLEPKVVDLNQVIADLQRMFKRLIGEDIELKTVTSVGLGLVKVDPNQIGQVLLNLVVNARDAMPRGGKLTIETANVELDEGYARSRDGVEPGQHVMLAVSDTGHGMDRETQSHIFEPFFTTKELGRGTGLGLSTVFGIVRQSGGHLWVYSEPGRGATFKVYLPRVGEEAPKPTQRPEPRVKTGTETILLVEDEEQVRKIVLAVLRRNGYAVLEAAGAREALRIARNPEYSFDLVLTDVVMPDMSGPELVRRVREVRIGVRALCMSGYTDETVLRHGILEGGMAFLQKPITPDALLRKVRSVLDDGSN
ncbi:MAG TPA: ATP-binding protein [Polyangiaceae bacterium]